MVYDIVTDVLPKSMAPLAKKTIAGAVALVVGALFYQPARQWIVLQLKRSITLDLGLAVVILACAGALPRIISALLRRSSRTRRATVAPGIIGLPAITQGDRARLLMCIPEYTPYPGCKCVFVIESSPPFQHRWEVSFVYYDESDVEILLGTGYVCHVQVNGKTQVGMTKQVDRHMSIIQRLCSNDTHMLNRCLVRLGKSRDREEETDNGPGI